MNTPNGPCQPNESRQTATHRWSSLRHLAGGLALGGLHIVFCALFFLQYFRSHDPERVLAFYIFWFFDPVPLLVLLGSGASETRAAWTIGLVGTAQWFLIGFVLQEVSVWIKSKGR